MTKSAELLELTVDRIMQTDVTTVSPGMSVREVARILADQNISGAPVVANDGRVEGVVSNTDVIRFTADAPDLQSVPVSFRGSSGGAWDADDEHVEPVYGDYFLPEEGPGMLPALGDDIGAGPLDEMTVEDIMTPVPFSLEASATLRELANFLLRGRIHRAVVTAEGRLVGIVTATDILRALAEFGE